MFLENQTIPKIIYYVYVVQYMCDTIRLGWSMEKILGIVVVVFFLKK